MRPARWAGGGGSFLPRPDTMAAKLAFALVGGSVLYALAADLRVWLLLSPAMVFGKLALWQPLTYAFIETSPMGVIFGALITYSIGGALEMTWGSRRLGLFAVGATVLAGALTLLVLLPFGSVWPIQFGGGTVLTTALWVAYGLSYGKGQTNFWGIPLSGNMLALIGVGFVFLNGAFNSFWSVIPEFLAVALAFAYVRMGSPRTAFLKLRNWRLQQRMRSRAKHLRVVGGERNMPADSDRYLH